MPNPASSSLKEALGSAQPLRILGLPPQDTPLCLVLLAKDLPKLPAWLLANADHKIDRVIIMDAQGEPQVKFKLPPSAGQPRFLGGVKHLSRLKDCVPVFLFMGEWPLRLASLGVPSLAVNPVYISAAEDKSLSHRKALPLFANKHLAKLEKVYAALHSNVDRGLFARRVKSIMTGDAGYLRVSPFLEYEHPDVLPRKGDVVLDGGLSHMVSAQKSLAEKVGPKGLCHGFEPIPWMAEEAARELEPYPWYHVHALGLGDKCGSARFASLADSSHLSNGSDEGEVECLLTTIDGFVDENRLEKLNVIKLDVEGSELAALKGGENAIREWLPDLIVCLYHKPEDIFEIPLFILEKFPGYELRLGHSSCCFTDTILYARHEGSRRGA